MFDDFCKDFTLQQEKYMIEDENTKHSNKLDRMNDAEIMIVFILFYFEASRSLQHNYKEYVGKHLKHLFSIQVFYNHFMELKKEVRFFLAVSIKEVLLRICTGISFVDSTQLCVIRNQRILIHKTFNGLAKCGKCSMRWFFVFKFHQTINDKETILNFMFTSRDVDEREPLKPNKFLKNIKGKLCAA